MPEEAAPAVEANPPGQAMRAVKNSIYAIIQYAWPIALAILITPYIVRGLGASAYGVLSIAAVTLGFFGLLDLGIGGAAIRAVSQHLEKGDGEEAAKVLGTVVTAYLIIGAIGGTALVIATPFLVSHVLAVPADLQSTARITFYISAVGFPVTLIVGAFASVPVSAQRFDLATRVAVVFSTLGPVSMLAMVHFGFGLPGVALSSLVLNAIGGVAYYRVSRGLLSGVKVRLGLNLGVLRGLAGFGGWFLVATVGVTILYQLDKILVGSLLSVAAVTYYVVPGNMANRIQGLMGAATRIVFPASSAMLARGDHEQVNRLYRDGTRLSFLMAASLGVPLAVMATPFLRYWMGPEFADRSSLVMVLLVGTYMFLGMTGVVWGLAFGSGKAWINAVFAIAMGVADIALFLALVGRYEIQGAALAYFISAAVGVPILIATVERLVLGLSGWEFLRQCGRVIPAVAVQALIAFGLEMTVARNLVLTLGAMAATAAALPILYLLLGLATAGDRALISQMVARLKPR
jgi:O-antigen/teichoic acid export membrane protein